MWDVCAEWISLIDFLYNVATASWSSQENNLYLLFFRQRHLSVLLKIKIQLIPSSGDF